MNVTTPPTDVVTCVNQADLEVLEEALQSWGFRVFSLDGAGISDKATLLERARQGLPLTEGGSLRSWSGLSDRLWGGLYEIEVDRVAIVWRDAQALLQQNLQEFLTVVRLFADVARSVGSSENGFSHPMALHLFLVGQGEMFPPLKRE